MKADEIFINDNSREDVYKYNQRFSFSLSNECRLYRYEKKIGVYLSIYFDSFDFSTLKEHFLSSRTKLKSDECHYSSSNPYIKLRAYAFNYDTQQYERIEIRGNDGYYPCEHKKSKNGELILSPEHISSDSKIQIKFDYKFGFTKSESTGFLHLNTSYFEYETSSDTLELESVIQAQRSYSQNNTYDDQGCDF